MGWEQRIIFINYSGQIKQSPIYDAKDRYIMYICYITNVSRFSVSVLFKKIYIIIGIVSIMYNMFNYV